MSLLTQLTSRREWRTVLTDYLGMIGALALLILAFSLSTRHFFSAVNFQMIANQIPAAVLVATGMTYVLIAVFLLSGLLVALAAITDTSRLGQAANPNAGNGFELQAIAAAVIGGTSLMGGRGSVVSTFFGVLIIAVLNLQFAIDPTSIRFMGPMRGKKSVRTLPEPRAGG